MMYSNNYGVPTTYETRVYDGVPYPEFCSLTIKKSSF